MVIQRILRFCVMMVMLGGMVGSHFSLANMSKIPPASDVPKVLITPIEKELTCTGGVKKTCTSKYAYACPKGWAACPLIGDNKTCCKQRRKIAFETLTESE